MDFIALNKKNIYPISAGDLWGITPDRLFMVYSPLSGHVLLSTQQELLELENACSNVIDATDTQTHLLNLLQQTGSQHVFHIPNSPNDIYEIDILSNFTCNFHCSYCYSAAGRSAKEVDLNQIKCLIDYLFLTEHPQQRPYKINFSGGGEPLISFPLIRKTIEYIDDIAQGTSFRYSYGLVTNGSLLTSEIIDFIIEKRINLIVSLSPL